MTVTRLKQTFYLAKYFFIFQTHELFNKVYQTVVNFKKLQV